MQQIDALVHQQRALQQENEWLIRSQAPGKPGERESTGTPGEDSTVGEAFLGKILQQSQLRDQDQLVMFQVRKGGKWLNGCEGLGCKRRRLRGRG